MRTLIAGLSLVCVGEAAAIVGLLITHGGSGPSLSGPDGFTPPATHTPANPVATPSPTASAYGDVAVVARLRADLDAAQAALADERQKRSEAERLAGNLGERLRKFVDENQKLREENAILRAGGKIPDGAVDTDDPRDKTDDELTDAEARARALRLFSHDVGAVLVVGKGIPEQVAASLGLTRDQRLAIEAACAVESDRVTAAVREFVRAEMGADAPADIDTLARLALVNRHLHPRLRIDGPKYQTMTGRELLAAKRGRKTLGDIVGTDSVTYRWATRLAEVRRQTWQALVPKLTPAQMAALRDRYLPLDTYRYADGTDFRFVRLTPR